MKNILVLAAFAALATDPSVSFAGNAPAAIATQGKMLYATGGKRLAAVYKVAADGSPQIILDGKLVTIPATSLSLDGDKITTSLSKKDLRTTN